MADDNRLLRNSGGYRKLKSFQIAQLIYDITVRFVELYVDKRSRTCDQMVQAARSGVQNIAEGSVASATSKKTELKLTNVARASLEELLLDYEDFLRQRGMPLPSPDSSVVLSIRRARLDNMADFRHFLSDLSVWAEVSLPQSGKVAITAITLINQSQMLLGKQLERLAEEFAMEGGFTERLYQVRSKTRRG